MKYNNKQVALHETNVFSLLFTTNILKYRISALTPYPAF
jgi:hypothetical protein